MVERVRGLLVWALLGGCGTNVLQPGGLALPTAPSAPSAPWFSGPFANEDGYDLWLRYPRVADPTLLAAYQAQLSSLIAGQSSATLTIAAQEQRFAEIAAFLKIQADEAKWWRDASLDHFGTFSGLPVPAEYEQPAQPLSFYQGLTACPADASKPRCPAVYTP